MCAKLGSRKLNTVVFRASYILPILRQFSCLKSSKTRGGDLPPPWKIQNRNQFVFLSFRVDPLYWLSFIEIGEMACSRPAWCTHGHTLKSTVADTREKKRVFYFLNHVKMWGPIQTTCFIVELVEPCIQVDYLIFCSVRIQIYVS